MASEIGLDGQASAPFAIVESTEFDAKKYAMRRGLKLQGEAEVDRAVYRLCEQYLANELKPTYKSEVLPDDNPEEVNGVQRISWDTLEAAAEAEESYLVLVYKPWNQNHEKAMASFKTIAKILMDAGVSSVIVSTFDSSQNYIGDGRYFPGLEEFHTKAACYLLPPSANVSRHFRGKLKRNDLLRFIKKHNSEVKAKWSAVAEAVRSVVAEEKQAARKKAEAAAKAAEERAALIANAELLELTDDGGVKLRRYASNGEGGSTPSSGATVRAHYTGTLRDGTKFDSSRDRGDPFSFTLGKGQVIRCWDLAFAEMRIGDKAVITCSSDYAYGDMGSPPTIPANAELEFDIELVDFTGGAREEL